MKILLRQVNCYCGVKKKSDRGKCTFAVISIWMIIFKAQELYVMLIEHYRIDKMIYFL